MARTSKGPRYYASKGAWYANLNGERVLLARGPKKATEKEAKENYDAEKAARRVELEGDRNTVWAVLNAFLQHRENLVEQGELSQSTLDMDRLAITPFSKRFGAMAVRKLRPQHITEFFAAMRQPRRHATVNMMVRWGDATVKLARNHLRTAFIWASEEAGLITCNPFKRRHGRKAKRQRRRPAESCVAITPHEHTLLVEQAARRSKKDFLHLMTFLHRTGARPAEMYLAKASEWVEKKKAFRVRAEPESRGRFKLAYLGEDRWVYIPADLVPLAKELMAKYPEGPIFRTEWGTPWDNESLCARMKSIKRAANRAAAEYGVPGVRKEVKAYSWRHAFVTRWVEANKPLQVLCELLNTSEAMIRQHYSHLFERTETLLDALNDFDQGTAAPPESPTARPA
jgi:site-specific recombinase XerD